MGKIKFSVSEDAFDQTGFAEAPKPGVYTVQCKEINAGWSKGDDGQEDPSRPRLECIYEVIDPKAKNMGNDGGSALGARVWDYITFGPDSQWHLAQFLSAFGMGSKQKRNGVLDTDKIAEKVTDIDKNKKKITRETGHPGLKCKIRVGPGANQNGEYRAKVRSILPLADENEDVEGDGFDTGVEEGEVEENGEAEGYTEEDLKAMQVPELKEVVKAFVDAGYSMDIKGKKKSEVIALILESQAASSNGEDEMVEDDEEIIDEEEESGYTEEALKSMATPDLKEVAKNLGVDFGGKKKSEVIVAILEAQTGADADSISDGDDPDPDLPF